LKDSAAAGADAFIISDPGVFCLAKETAPGTAVHVSTQANTTNSEAVKFWRGLGAERIILARECSLADIRRIRESVPDETELEAFVHGAMCVAYSGRCLLSQYLLKRGANQGDCAQPCRYMYHVVEETRPGVYLPVTEDEGGTALFSASDLCMAEYLPELTGAGIGSFKIEGRMKTSFYVGLTTHIYRKAIDTFCADPRRYAEMKKFYAADLEKSSHRGAAGFSTGFYFGAPVPPGEAQLAQGGVFAGVVLDYDSETGIAAVEQRNKFSAGDELEIFCGSGASFTQIAEGMRNENGALIESAPHPKQRVFLKMSRPVEAYDLIRKVTPAP
ncbi:MAG: U32 family peptidase C-terminal domain-containing protein, partial [Clostridiales bacterium]|nr:U32 family peptidase C-terminal domain-containing protein [Clostridiales bacterium]